MVQRGIYTWWKEYVTIGQVEAKSHRALASLESKKTAGLKKRLIMKTVEGRGNSQVEVIKNHLSNHLKRRFTFLLNLKKITSPLKEARQMKKFLILIILIMTGIVWASSGTELSPKEAVSFIDTALSKKGFKNLGVTYGKIIKSTKHNIFIEFGAKGRSVKETVDIVYESALIVGSLQIKKRHLRGGPLNLFLQNNPNGLLFKVNTLRFTKNGKLVSWIHSNYCQKAIWDDMIQSSLEREQFILSHLQHER